MTSDEGGGVPRSNLRLLLGRRADDPDRSGADVEPTKDNIVQALNEVVSAAEADGDAEQLYFYFSGHGVTAELAGREESALVMPGFDTQHTDHSLAVRSHRRAPRDDVVRGPVLLRRRVPERAAAAATGRSGGGRSRAAATRGSRRCSSSSSTRPRPGLKAVEVGWPGDALGAFTEVLHGGPGRRRAGEGVVVGAELLRGALGAARDVRQPGDARQAALRRVPRATRRPAAGRSRSRRTRAAGAWPTATATRASRRTRAAASATSS